MANIERKCIEILSFTKSSRIIYSGLFTETIILITILIIFNYLLLLFVINYFNILIIILIKTNLKQIYYIIIL